MDAGLIFVVREDGMNKLRHDAGLAFVVRDDDINLRQ
jgi:hypothetical protein